MGAIVILGGVRSGKSRLAERMVMSFPHVTYIAPGPVPEPDAPTDPEWAARVAAHRAQRPASWATVETGDVPGAITDAATDGRPSHESAVLVDCLGTWITRVIDEADAWDDQRVGDTTVREAAENLGEALRVATTAARTVVCVTNEVGLGVVPAHRSGRLFRDALGRVNQVAADNSERVVLVVAGRVLDLSASPTVDDFAAAFRATGPAPRLA